jgi:hypothetical protein
LFAVLAGAGIDMLPGNVLSTTLEYAAFLSPRDAPPQALVDYDNGPIALSDPSQGLFARKWRGRYEDGSVIYDAPGVPDQIISVIAGVTALSITFDQNGRPCYAYVDGTGSHMYWYNTVDAAFEIYDLPSGASTPKVSLDDKREFNIGGSDIILSYINGGNLYARQQRDRFGVEYLLKSDVGGYLRRVGMNLNFRYQWEIGH